MKTRMIRLFSLALLFTTSVSAWAEPYEVPQSETSTQPRQEPSSGRFLRRLIIEGSLVNAGYQGGDTSRYKKPNGYSAGLLLDLVGTANLVIETGVLYRQLGTSLENSVEDRDFTANYISVPVSAKYYFGGQEGTSLYAKAGVMGSTLISNNSLYTTPTTKIGARRWETSLLAGLGFKLNVATATDVLVEADYARAFESVFPDTDIYRSDFSGTLGLAFAL